MGIIKSVPTIDHATSWMVPLIKTLAASKLPSQLYQDGRDALCVSQDLILGLLDAPTKRPKRVTDLYAKRERQLIDAIQTQLGDEWWITKDYFGPVSGINYTLVRVFPDRTTLLYDQQEPEVLLPGLSMRSGNQINFCFYAYQFETDAFATAFKLMVL